MRELPTDTERNSRQTHSIRVGSTLFEDTASGKKNFELVKAREKYKVGDVVEILEFKDGKYTGHYCKKTVTYILNDCTGLNDGFCVLGCQLIEVGLNGAGNAADQSAGSDAAQPVLNYGA